MLSVHNSDVVAEEFAAITEAGADDTGSIVSVSVSSSASNRPASVISDGFTTLVTQQRDQFNRTGVLPATRRPAAAAQAIPGMAVYPDGRFLPPARRRSEPTGNSPAFMVNQQQLPANTKI